MECTERVFSGRLRRYCVNSGMEVTKSPHDIRRSVLTNLDQEKVPIGAISKIAGHKSQKQTEEYLRVTEQRMAEHDYTEVLVKSESTGGKIIPFRKMA